jgi:hypothetical protein
MEMHRDIEDLFGEATGVPHSPLDANSFGT